MIVANPLDPGSLLEAIAAELDISDDLYESAVVKYTEVGEWLAADDSALRSFAPEIYPQGSFRLGTCVRPIRGGGGEYDIDLVCRLGLEKEGITQRDLKEMVGKRLRQKEEYAAILEQSRRCWVLPFSQKFHLDVLPSIPNVERPPTGILLTDKELRLWQYSNPKGYADWFHSQMSALIEQMLKASVEDVPEWKVRTPLQRACQLLKRHRDIMFKDRPETRPTSIIISTLAAKAYRGESRIPDAVRGILGGMRQHILYERSKWQIGNPADPDENFADKWNEKPERMLAFFEWHERATKDFGVFFAARTLDEQRQTLSASLRPSDGVFRPTPRDGWITLSALTESVPALSDDRHSKIAPWLMTNRYKATVKANVYLSKNSKRALWGLTARPVDKGRWLWFSVDTNTPPPYEVQWQVVNTGQEARQQNQLRGDFYPSESAASRGRWEQTAYAGTHWVKGYVIKDGACVAQSEKKYVKVKS